MKEAKYVYKCSKCHFCQRKGRAEGQSGRILGRAKFYCTHGMADTLQMQLTVNGSGGFIGFGELDTDVLQVKTAPKWCPRKHGYALGGGDKK